MTEHDSEPKQSSQVASLLTALRSRIRGYVWAEGIAIALVWLGVTFWIAIGIDYLPVLFGMSELPWQARAFLLAIIGLVLLLILYRYVARRAFVKLRDRSMALILERRFEELDDSLITSVEANERTHFAALREKADREQKLAAGDPEMLEFTRKQAEARIAGLKIGQVFNLKPLVFSGLGAVMLLTSIGVFAAANTDGFLLGSKRLYLLKQEPWPRRSLIELVGAKVHRENPVEGIQDIGQVVSFEGNQIRVARGASMTLLVRAAAADDRHPDRKVPSTCNVIFRTSDGQRGSQAMKKIGSPRNGYQLYSLDTEPFKGMLSDMKFELRGGDHRLGPFTVKVVQSPTVVQTKLDCRFPDYMVDQDSGRWTSREIDWSSGLRLPQGTGITIRCRANKPLTDVYVYDKKQDTMQRLSIDDRDSFEWVVASLADALSYEFILKDEDGVIAEDPHRIVIGSIEDQAPQVDTLLSGIGSAVTPDVRIPLRGQIKDDYGTRRTWVEVETGVTEPLEQEFSTSGKGDVETAVDFRERRQAENGFSLSTEPESKITLVIKAEDKFDLGGQQANIGVGDQYVLEVVPADQLLRILDRGEVNQRKRLEQIFEELGAARSLLVKTRNNPSSFSGAVEPGEEPGDGGSDNPVRRRELRLLYAQRSTLQVQKSIQELIGVADSFDNIRMQLINNRVDSEDRKIRLEKKIVLPLRQISGTVEHEAGRSDLKSLDKTIVELEGFLAEIQSNRSENLEEQAELLAEKSLEQIDDVLIQVNSLLAILLKYENQSELIEIVQRFLDQQKGLLDRTKKERERRAFDGLLD